MTRLLPVALLLSIAPLVSASAHAHALLAAPKPRDNRDGYKDPNGPCGIAATASQTRTALTAGASYTVTWKETITHPGCFVVDFSASGDTNFQVIGKKSHASPPAPSNPTTANPRNWSLAVTLPSTPCTTCTLRLRQIMVNSDLTEAQCPPATIPNGATYYSCANVSIGDGGGAGGTGGAGGGAGSSGRGGATGAAGTGGSTGQAGATGNAGTTGAAGDGRGGSSATGAAGTTGAAGAGVTGEAGTTGAGGYNATGAAGTGSPTGSAGTTGGGGSGDSTGTAGTKGPGLTEEGGCAVAGGGAGPGGLLVLVGIGQMWRMWIVSRRRRRRSRS